MAGDSDSSPSPRKLLKPQTLARPSSTSSASWSGPRLSLAAPCASGTSPPFAGRPRKGCLLVNGLSMFLFVIRFKTCTEMMHRCLVAGMSCCGL
ncbi:uncharacterized protein LOC131146656 isoform X2 [Malania oleifera]|uniref:uncharacterized protein LOC131146656 isoform X2 n=1 Tax=Malania oleifera TaxID=397392 RepID=UPI0025AE2427|nr:uncharacterized protein LOC131146656 isoform X2 [Malania oleifera]